MVSRDVLGTGYATGRPMNGGLQIENAKLKALVDELKGQISVLSERAAQHAYMAAHWKQQFEALAVDRPPRPENTEVMSKENPDAP